MLLLVATWVFSILIYFVIAIVPWWKQSIGENQCLMGEEPLLPGLRKLLVLKLVWVNNNWDLPEQKNWIFDTILRIKRSKLQWGKRWRGVSVSVTTDRSNGKLCTLACIWFLKQQLIENSSPQNRLIVLRRFMHLFATTMMWHGVEMAWKWHCQF